MNSTDHRCICGGIMILGTKRNAVTGKDEIWRVCPFCHAQRPAEVAAQENTDEDQILTQEV